MPDRATVTRLRKEFGVLRKFRREVGKLPLKHIAPSWNTLVSDAWLDPELRALFECEEGYRPLAKYGPALEQDIEDGFYHRYECAFKGWLLRSPWSEAAKTSLKQRSDRLKVAQPSRH